MLLSYFIINYELIYLFLLFIDDILSINYLVISSVSTLWF